MQLSHRTFGLLFCASLAGCSLVLDFDRNKIPRTQLPDGGGYPEASPGDGDVGMDASLDAAADTGAPPSDARVDGGTQTPCHKNSDCGADELCCNKLCVATSVDACQACGIPCDLNVAASCVNRTCICEPSTKGGQACSGTGADKFCDGEANPPVCVECRDAQDCAGRTDGKLQCVAGACAACSPTANAGCSGTTPICNAGTLTCVGCDPQHKCPSPLICAASGACNGCSDSATDCTSPTAPICDATSKECRPCASDGPLTSDSSECLGELNEQYCPDNQHCSPCLPTSEAGCTDINKPDCRINDAGDYECLACRNDTDCAGLQNPLRDQCDTSTGRCVDCVADQDCAGTTPVCNLSTHRCQACTTDSQCDAITASSVCVTSGGQTGACATCNPANDDGCSGAKPYCSAALSCVQCLGVSDCGNQLCVSGSCTACGTDADCVGHPLGEQCVSGSCRACDPSNNAGCGDAGTCSAGFTCQ